MSGSTIQWDANLLQVALFSKVPFPMSLDIYSALMGVPADSSEERPKEGVRRQTGVAGNTYIQIGITPVRIDIVFAPVQEAVSLDVTSLQTSIGPFEEELKKFAKLILGWLPQIEVPLLRISFIGVAVAPASSRDESYSIVAQSVKSLKVDTSMHDLMYRVNWRAPTDLVPEKYLNRLTTWSSFKFRISAGLDQSNAMEIGERNFARLDLDINTPGERVEPLVHKDIGPLFEELFRLAAENIAQGECK
ncbi:hypothetical protein AB7828_24880 [Tardiphaga sp. 215_C5_N2_1]|uniref:hypothetical protein n=1 Tax=Tardiphaga sp. 215_C5_N2_1 TaxID=3240774 RepID=UPI003F89F6C0